MGGDPARLPSPLPPPLERSARLLANQRPPWEAAVPLEELAAAGFPTLVISGGHSSLFDSVCDALEAALAARRAVIPGAGHSIPTTGAPYNEAVAAFWADADPAGRPGSEHG